jgi:hypothetical protein
VRRAGFSFVVDSWGNMETHEFMCCQKAMKAKKVAGAK